MRRDYYSILEILRETNGEGIKKAYRRLALLYHPDRNLENKREAEERFKEIGEAYEILSDPKTRERYDLLGFNGIRDIVNNIRPSRYYERFNEVFSDREKMEVFSLQQTYDKGYRRGYDLHHSLNLSLQELKKGIEKVIEIERREYCHTCKGKKKVNPAPASRSGVKDRVCPECFGLGRKSYKHRVKVKIPPETKLGEEMVLSGKGHQGFKGAPSGDLKVKIEESKSAH